MTSKTNFPASSGFVAISLIVLPGRYMQPWKIESEAFKINRNVISFELNLIWRTGRIVMGWWRGTWKLATQLWTGPFGCSDLSQIKWQLCEHKGGAWGDKEDKVLTREWAERVPSTTCVSSYFSKSPNSWPNQTPDLCGGHVETGGILPPARSPDAALRTEPRSSRRCSTQQQQLLSSTLQESVLLLSTSTVYYSLSPFINSPSKVLLHKFTSEEMGSEWFCDLPNVTELGSGRNSSQKWVHSLCSSPSQLRCWDPSA